MWALGAFHVSPLAATYSDLLRQAATRLDLQLAVIQFYFYSSQARLKCAAAFEVHLYLHTHTQWHTHSTHSQTYPTCYTCHTHMQHTLYPSKKSFFPNFVIFLIKTHSAWLSFNTNKTHIVTTAHTLIHTHTYSYNHTVTFSGNLVNASQRSSSPDMSPKNTAKNKKGS